MSTQLFATVSIEQQEIVAGGSGDSRLLATQEKSRFNEFVKADTKTRANRRGAETSTDFKQYIDALAVLKAVAIF